MKNRRRLMMVFQILPYSKFRKLFLFTMEMGINITFILRFSFKLSYLFREIESTLTSSKKEDGSKSGISSMSNKGSRF